MEKDVKLTLVTPQLAERWLREHNTHNRPIYQKLVETYALDMKRGYWARNHQGICFDEEGTLIDGQHRLMAIIRSGCSVEFYVFRGIPTHYGENGFTQDTIDAMKTRGKGDQLHLSYGMSHANQKVAMVNAIKTICHNDGGKLTIMTTKAIYDIYSKEIDMVVNGIINNKTPGLLVAPALGAFAFAAKPFPKEVMAFEEPYFTGENLKRGSPILTYRNWMMTRDAYISGRSRTTIMTNALSALMHYVLGKDLRILKPNGSSVEFFRNKQRSSVVAVVEELKL